MTAQEIYNLIQTGNQQDAQRALFEMLALLQELSTATFEVAYEVKQLTGRDPMGQRPRQWLSEFLELPKKELTEGNFAQLNLHKTTKGTLMKRTIIAAVMLVAVLALALSINTVLNKTNAQSVVRKTSQVNTAERLGTTPCSLKTVLPGALSLKLECDSCCDAGHIAYEYCRDYTNNSTCECIQAGYEACMDGGCGPCICCGDWITRGKWHGCINDESEWKKKAAVGPVGPKQ